MRQKNQPKKMSKEPMAKRHRVRLTTREIFQDIRYKTQHQGRETMARTETLLKQDQPIEQTKTPQKEDSENSKTIRRRIRQPEQHTREGERTRSEIHIHLAPRTDRSHHRASQEKQLSSQTKPETTPKPTWEKAAANLEQGSRSKDKNYSLLLTNKQNPSQRRNPPDE
ncbi:hypothetical protein ISN45_Aa07g032270 [Arabidopsis thaliana x Arabidopsis arenosa]|uniref:Uncharacterized protein n=1 Tax=Arabidopsis thaliana x Arabidopsis arenosa TaxID=1240361 RepID=A0A8T1YC17_9BRAS|nr:hypothetical protein ISN45_Aa07g032270 [Arabidopsis thaliana x Arabidopsis arenosa]